VPVPAGLPVSEAVHVSEEGLMGRVFNPKPSPKYKRYAWDRDTATDLMIEIGRIIDPMPIDLEIVGDGYNVILPLEGLVRIHAESYQRGRADAEAPRNQEG
jgi:hypothetical protein